MVEGGGGRLVNDSERGRNGRVILHIDRNV